MFSRIKKLLAECHLKAGDPAFKAAVEAQPSYLITRAREALDTIDTCSLQEGMLGKAVADKNAILIIRLMALLRYHLDTKNGQTNN